jgi:nitroreductase
MLVQRNDAWGVSEDDFPRSSPVEAQLGFLLRYAILAPSVRNTQPWAFSVQGNRVHLIADVRKAQPVADPDGRELHISLGCALENLLVAAEHFGFGHGIAYFPEREAPDLVAIATFEPGGTPSPARAGATLTSILTRHNDDGVFRPAPVPEWLRMRLVACCVEPDLQILLTDDRPFHNWIDALTLEADRAELANPGFRRELNYWIGQGVFGSPPVRERLRHAANTRPELAEHVARRDHAIMESAALLGLICATGDSHLHHVRAGQLFERLWLTATAMGVGINPMSQTMRHPQLRAGVGELLPSAGWTPQHLFRVGFGSSAAGQRTPRRPVDDVVV